PSIRIRVSDALSGPDASQAQLRVDGLTVSPIRGVDLFSYVPVGELSEGEHTVQASAHDRAGNRGDLVASFRVDAQPPAAATAPSPAGGALLSGVVSLAGSATDVGSGVARLSFFCDGYWIAEASTASGLTASWNTAAIAEGEHSITARATDVAGNSG